MTHQPHNPDAKELEALYRSGRDIEPEPGLDRIIRARAEQAARQGKPQRPARWLGGLATAAALVLAIGVALQQSPPEHAELEEALQTSAPAPARRAERAEEPAPALQREMLSDRAGQSESDAAVTASRQRAPSPAASFRAEEAPALEVLAEPEPDAWLGRIERLIEHDHLHEAREQLDQFRNQFPETEIPQSINQALAEPEND